ncbi:MAG: hypothetical protein ACFFCE_18525 [Promethearchaeota archaeon]
MLFVELEVLYQLSGLLGLLAVLIAWIYGAISLIKYIHTKEKLLFYFFLAVIFTISPWYPSGLGYIYWLITRQEIAYPVYVLIGTIGVPIALLSWLQIYMSMLHSKYKNHMIIITIGISIAFFIYLFYFLFFASGAPVDALIGTKDSPIDISYKGFVLGFLGFSLVVSTITGNDFSIASLKVRDNPEIPWKGRFLIISFNLYAIGALGDGFLPLAPVTLIIFRTLMMLSSTFYYIGFILPNWVKRFLKLE